MTADGTKIAERWAPMYKNAMAISEERPQSAASALAGVVTETIEELSAAEERERVLRDLIKKRFGKCGRSGCRAVTGVVNRNFCPDCAAIDAALAIPTPEQPAQPSAEKAGSK